MTGPARQKQGDWSLVGGGVLAAVLSYVNRQAPTLLVDPLRRDLGLDDMQVSLLIGASFAVIYALSSLIFGWLADRHSRTRIIAFAILSWSAGSVGCAFASDFWSLFACRMVIGASEAALIPAALSLIGDNFAEERRGLATGTFLVGVFGGAGGSIIVVGYLLGITGQGWLAAWPYATVPWRQVFLLAALPGLILIPFFLLRRDSRTSLSASAPFQAISGVGLMPWGSIALLCGAMTLLAIADNALLAWSPSLLIRDYGLSAERVGSYLGTSLMLGGGGGVLLGGWLSDYRTRRAGGRVAVCAMAVLLAMPLLLFIASGPALAVIACIGVYLALSAAATCAGIAALLTIAPPGRRGLVTSILTLSTVALGFGIGPSLTVILAGMLGGLSHGLMTVSIGSLLGALILFALHIGIWRGQPLPIEV